MMYEDISLYKKDLEAKIVAEYKIEALKRRNEELIQYNYPASHDLQEPLSTISSFSKLLNENYAHQLDDEAKQFLSIINDSSNRMSDLIKDLLVYSKSSQAPSLQANNFNSILKTVLNDLNYQIALKNVHIEVDHLPTLVSSKTRIHSLFLNLIENAIKFTAPDRRPEINISCQEEENHYKFCISDNGIGIENQYHDKIFGVFKRLHTKSEYEGTGIGLALCEKAVEVYDGNLWLESEFGKGSSFYFTIKKISL